MMDTFSTSGHFIEIVGAGDRGMPLSWAARKQGGTAQHTAEAETVSMAACLRNEAIPLQSLMQAILRRPIDLEIMEANAATITSVNKGYSPSLRHLPRTQRVSLGLLHESITAKPENGEGNILLDRVIPVRRHCPCLEFFSQSESPRILHSPELGSSRSCVVTGDVQSCSLFCTSPELWPQEFLFGSEK